MLQFWLWLVLIDDTPIADPPVEDRILQQMMRLTGTRFSGEFLSTCAKFDQFFDASGYLSQPTTRSI